jgi:hypothetical protein
MNVEQDATGTLTKAEQAEQAKQGAILMRAFFEAVASANKVNSREQRSFFCWDVAVAMLLVLHVFHLFVAYLVITVLMEVTTSSDLDNSNSWRLACVNGEIPDKICGLSCWLNGWFIFFAKGWWRGTGL